MYGFLVALALYMATMYNVFGLQGFNTKTIPISFRSIYTLYSSTYLYVCRNYLHH